MARGHKRLKCRRGWRDRNRLAEANLALVGWCVERWAGTPAVRLLGREDAFQAGCLGLLRAAALWDRRRGVTFATYAYRWVWQYVGRAAYEAHRIRVPDWLTHRKRAHAGRHGAAAERALACGQFGVGEDGAAQEPPDRREGPEEEAQRNEARDRAERLLLRLHPRARAVLRRRMGGETLQQIADSLGVTREAVRQTEAKALARLRRLLGGRP